MLKDIDLHREENTDGLKIRHDFFYQQLQEFLAWKRMDEEGLVETSTEIQLGAVVVVEGLETVSDSLISHPPNPNSFKVKG